MNFVLKLFLLIGLLNQISCGPIPSQLRSACGSSSSAVQALDSYSDCESHDCCCHYSLQRQVLKSEALTLENEKCKPVFNKAIEELDTKCKKQSMIDNKCHIGVVIIRRYPNVWAFIRVSDQFAIDGTHTHPPSVFEKRGHNQTNRLEPIGSSLIWLVAILFSIALLLLIVMLYAFNKAFKSEAKQPINHIKNVKQKTVPNVYSPL